MQPTLFGDDEMVVAEQPVVTIPQLPKSVGALPDNIPRYAIFRNKRVRVVSYEGDNKFTVLDTNDQYRSLHRDQMAFVKPRRKTA